MSMPMISDQQLIAWLDQRLPAFRRYLSQAVTAEGRDEPDAEPLSAYFIFSFAVKPYIAELLARGDRPELTRVFALLEELATSGDAVVKNELGVTMEELERHRVWPYLGPTMRQNEWTALTWVPTWKDRETRQNMHVDLIRYQNRWCEEIAALGGVGRMTVAHELRIRYLLVQEFKIEQLRAPEPGGEEWRVMRLPWPVPPPVDEH